LKSAPKTEVLVPRAKHIASIGATPHQGRSTHESLPAVEGTPPYSRFEGDPTDKNRAPPPVARRKRARKHPLHGLENLHHRGAVGCELFCRKWLAESVTTTWTV